MKKTQPNQTATTPPAAAPSPTGTNPPAAALPDTCTRVFDAAIQYLCLDEASLLSRTDPVAFGRSDPLLEQD